MRRYRYYDLVLAGFVAVLLCSNLIGTAKVSEVALPIVGGVFAFGVGNIFFPISYIFGDVLTEVYGYARARRVIWAGFPRDGVRERHGVGRREPAGVADRAVQRDAAARDRGRVRQHLAHRRRVDRRVLGRRLRQRLRARAAQGADARPLALDAHDRLDDRRARASTA